MRTRCQVKQRRVFGDIEGDNMHGSIPDWVIWVIAHPGTTLMMAAILFVILAVCALVIFRK